MGSSPFLGTTEAGRLQQLREAGTQMPFNGGRLLGQTLRRLGVPVVPIIASNGQGIPELRRQIISSLQTGISGTARQFCELPAALKTEAQAVAGAPIRCGGRGASICEGSLRVVVPVGPSTSSSSPFNPFLNSLIPLPSDRPTEGRLRP